MLTTFTQNLRQVEKDKTVGKPQKLFHSNSFLVNLIDLLLLTFKNPIRRESQREEFRMKGRDGIEPLSYEMLGLDKENWIFRYRVDMDDGPSIRRRRKRSLIKEHPFDKTFNLKLDKNKSHLTKVKKSMGNTTLLLNKMHRSIAMTFVMLLTMFSAFAQLPTVDVKLSKKINKSQPTIGEQITYTLYVKNEGTSTGHNIVVEDKLPIAGITYLNGAASSGSWNYNTSTGIGTWTIASLAPKDSVKLEVNASVLAEGVYFNVAEVKSMTEEDYDSVPNNKKLYEDDIATACFSVPIIWYLGDEYTVSVPAEFTGISNVVWMRNGVPITANTPQAVVNADKTLTIKGIGSYTFTSDVSSCNATGCCAIELVDGTKFDLALRKTSDATSAMPGQDVTFKIEVFNQGNVNATAVQVADYIPTGFTLNDADWILAGSTATLKTPIALVEAGKSVSVEITLKVNANVTDATKLVNFAEVASAKGPNGETVTDIDSTPDTNSSNDGTVKDDVITENGKTGGDEDDHDRAELTIIEDKVFDLALMKTTSATVVKRGDVVPFTITVYNQGTEQASAIKVADYIPAGFELADNSWTLTSGIAYKTIAGPIAPGGSANVTISLKVKADATMGQLTNVAEVAEALNSKGQPAVDVDSNLDNIADNDGTPKNDVVYENGKNGGDEDDHDPASVTVTGDFDLALKKVLATTGSVKPGDNVTFTISLVNQGELDATNIQVTDYIPTGLILNDANWQQTGTLATLKTPVASVLSGKSTTVNITFKIDPAFAGTSIDNFAEISSAKGPNGIDVTDIDSTPDQNSANDGTVKDDVISENGKTGGDEDDHDKANLPVTQVFDLALVKKTTTTVAKPGDIVTFTITVSNQGTLEAKNVQVADYIPSGFTLNDAAWNVTASKATLQIPIASIKPGESKDVTIKLKVNSDVTDGTNLVNAAEIKSAENTLNLPDVDSTPDDVATNDGTPKDDVTNENGKTGGDEDDHDIAPIKVDNKVFDLALAKAANSATATAGDMITYTITVKNEGNVNATAIEIMDNIPTGFTLADSMWTAASGKAVLKTPIASLAAGASTTRTITFKIGDNVSGSVTNTAEIIGSKDGNGNPVDDKDSTPNNGNPNEDDLGKSTITVTPKSTCDEITSVTAGDDNLCVGESTALKAVSSKGTSVKWYLSGIGGTAIGTTASGATFDVQPTTTTTYYVELATVAANCPNTRVPVTVVVNARPSNPTCGEAIEICVGETTNLNDHIINVPSTPGGVFEWHVGALPTSALVTNPTAAGAGKYYLFEKSTAGCYSNPTQVVVKTKACDKLIDLSLRKTANKHNVVKGDVITYTIEVKNDGPDNATGIVVKDVLPAGLSFVSSTDFTNAANTLTATIAQLNTGQTKVLTFQAKVEGSGTIVNISQVTAADQKDSDSTPGNAPTVNEDDDDDEAIFVEEQKVFDLALSKSANTGTVTAGGTATFTITVTNQGDVTATNIEVKDVIPTGLTLSDANWVMVGSNAELKTPIASLAPGASTTRTITFNVASTATGSIKNLAEIKGAKDASGNPIQDKDSTPNNNVNGEDDQDDAVITIGAPTCDEITSLIATNANICVGESTELKAVSSKGTSIKWYLAAVGGTAITTTASGAAYAVTPTTTTTYYAELATVVQGCSNTRMPVVVVVNARPSNPTCGEAIEVCKGETTNLNSHIINAPSTPGGVFEWHIGPLSTSALVPNPTAAGPGKYFLFEKSGAGCYSNPTQVIVKEKACDKTIDLSLRKTADKRDVKVNDIVTYTIEVKNDGPDVATGVVVKDILPTGLTFVASPNFTNSSNTLTATIPTINAGQTILLVYQAKVVGSGTIINYTQITAADQKDSDSTPGNGPTINEDDDDDEVIYVEQVVTVADLSLDKISSTSTANVGDNIQYKIKITNNGPNVARNVEATDNIPAGLSFVSATGGDMINVAGTLVTAKFNTINVGSTVEFIVIAKVTATGSITNYAQITKSDQSDSDSTPNNNSVNEDDDDSETIVVKDNCNVVTPLIACANPYICAGGKATITAIGCTGGSIIWSNGQTGTTIEVQPTTTTTYTAQCKIGECLSGNSNPVTVVVNKVSAPVIAASATTICSGNKVTLTATGCAGTVAWSNGMTGSSIEITPSATATYTAICKVADCESDKSSAITITVGGSTTAPTIAASSTSICKGSTVSLTATGCTGTVTWSNGSTGNAITVSPSATATYTATCTTGTCVSPASSPVTVTVTEGATITITASKEATCGGEAVTLTVVGCSGTVTWNTGATGATLSVTPTATTTYTASCAMGTCTSSATKTITVGSGGTAPTITASKETVCEGESVTLTATGCAGTLAWSTGATTASITVTPTATTTYTATCTTGSSCTGTTSKVVTVTPKPTAPIVTCGAERICAGEALTFTAHNCAGTVTWSTGATGATMVVTPTVTTVYWATCTVNGCVSAKSKEVTITVLTQKPTITASKETICSGESVTLTAGNCAGTLVWSTGATTASITVTPSATTTYTADCTVEGCKATETRTITVSGKNETPTITASKETSCGGESVTLTATGCTGTLTWSTGATGNAITVLPTVTTTYTATCSNGTCTGSATKTITVSPVSVPTITATKETTCGNEAVTLTAGTCSGTISWSTGATGSTLTVTPTTTTTYTATCTSGTCTASATKTISVTKPTAPVISANKTQLCAAGEVTLTATGCAGTVVWSNGKEGASITTLVSSTTTFAAACKVGTCESGKSNDVVVTIGGGETPTISASKTSICAGDSATLTAAACTGTLTWSTGATGASIKVKPTVTTTYTVTCTKNECTGSATATITVGSGETPTITASKDATCGSEQVTLTAAGCTGTVSWSTGATGNTLTVTPTATTTYTATCGTGSCAKTATKTITVTPTTAPVISANKTQLCAADSVTLTATGCTGTIKWSNTMTGASIKVKVSATTTFSAACVNGNCTSGKSNDVTVTVGKPTAPVITASGTTVCSGSSVTLTATGCEGTVVWSNSLTGNSITVSPVAKTTYTAVCKVATCTSDNSNEVTINVTGKPNAPVISCSATTICPGDEITFTALGCDGTVTWSNGSTGASITVKPAATTTYTATCKIGECVSAASAPATVNVGSPAAPLVVCKNLQICAGSSTEIEAKGCIGEVVWSTGQKGSVITVSPTTMTSYSAICDMGKCKSGESNILTVAVAGSAKKPTTKDLVNVCPNVTVDLTTGVTSTLSTGSTYLFRTANSATAPAVADPSKVTTGTYYVFEKTGNTCISEGAAINVVISSCEVTTNCATNPATASAGKDSTICLSSDFFNLNGKIGGSATSSTWTSDGTGKFENSLSKATKYFYSLDDIKKGTVKFTLTTNDPDGAGTCIAATSSFTLTINAIKDKPVITSSKSPNICFGDSVTLTAPEASAYLWSTGAKTRSIVIKTTGSYTVKLVNASGCCSVSSDAMLVNVRSSIAAPTVNAIAKNVCPATSVNLATNVTSTPKTTGGVFEYHTANSPTSTMLANVAAVPAGDYFVFEKSDLGCYSTSSKIKVTIDNCETQTTDADIAVDIDGSKAEIKLGDELTYTLKVKNNGPAVATNVKIVNTLPVGLELVSGTSGLTKVDNKLSATIASIAVGETKTYTYVAKVIKAGEVINKFEMTGLTQVDPTSSNNYDEYKVQCSTCQEVCVATSLAADTTRQANGNYRVKFTSIVQNCGNVDLSGVELKLALSKMFKSPTSFTVVQQPTASKGSLLVVNPGFNGTTDTNLVNTATSVLKVGKMDTVTYVINLVPNGSQGPFSGNSIAKAQGLTIFGTTAESSDVSNDGKIIDKASATATVIKLFKSPSIGLALAIVDTVKQSNGCYNVTFKAIVKNSGSLNLTNVVIADSLFKSFASPVTFTMVGKPKKNAGSTLVIDEAFTGKKPNVNLTTAASTLAIGKVDTVTFVMNLCRGDVKEFSNNAIVQGTGTLENGSTETVVDVSNEGYNPDAPGSNATELIFGNNNSSIQIPCIGVALYVADIAKQTDASYNVTYKSLIRNCGNLALSKVSICDTLLNTFGSPATSSIVGKPKVNSGSSLVVDSTFDGKLKLCLLDSTKSTLAVNKVDTLTWVVNVKTNGFNGPFKNNVTVTAKTPAGQSISDVSNDGTNSLPDGNTPTVINFNVVNDTLIGIAKEVKSLKRVNNTSNVFDVEFKFTVKNYSQVNLTKIQIQDNLSTVFGDTVSVDSVKVTAGTGLTANTKYTGKGQLINLLVDSTSTLAKGATNTVELFARVDLLNAKRTKYENVALVIAKAGTKEINDLSTTGTNPDPNADGSPKDNSLPTSVDFGSVIVPAEFTPLGIAKAAVVDTALNADGSYKVNFTVIVKNYGTRQLTKVQLVDELGDVFAVDSTDFGIVTKPTLKNASSKLKLNPDFNGTTKTNILVADSSSLAAGKADTITFVLKVLNKSKIAKTYNNTINGTALDSAKNVTDVSQSGLNPDANGNSNPGDDSAPTPFTIKASKADTTSGVVIIPGAISPNGDGKNDGWLITNITQNDEVKVLIYNRWGQLVFLTENYAKYIEENGGWKGETNQGVATSGAGVPDGTYFYCVESKTTKVNEGKPLFNFITVAR